MKSLYISILIFSITGISFLSGCKNRDKDKPNLLFITVDTTRADHLGCYGYKTAHTPNLDMLAQNGVVLENAISCVPMTLPSHTTLFTGLIPPEHGIRVNAENALNKNIPTLAEILKANNYNTGAVTASTVVDGSYGLNRGFDNYSDNIQLNSNTLYRCGEKVADYSIAWLKSIINNKDDNPWLLWSHFYDPHQPAHLQAEFSQAVADNAYDSEIAYMDKHIGRIIQWLDENGQLDNTIIVVVGDHGEGLGDHGEDEHAFYIYQSTQHVPCIFTWKNHLPKSTRIPLFISSADIMPTLLDLMSINTQIYKPHNDKRNKTLKDSLDRSFASVLRNPSAEMPQRPCYVESLWGYHMLNWAPLFGVIDHNHKFIQAPRKELYNLLTDPGELKNLSKKQPRIADDLSIVIEEIEADVVKPEVSTAQISDQKLNTIKSLGYVAGGTGTVKEPTNIKLSSLKDPKDFTAVANLQSKAHTLKTVNPAGDATLSACKKLIKMQPDASIFHVWLADCYVERNELELAKQSYKDAIRYNKEMFLAYNGLAMVTADEHNFKEALPLFKKAYDLRPGDATIKNNIIKDLLYMAQNEQKKGNRDEALELCKQALELDQANTTAKKMLSELQ